MKPQILVFASGSETGGGSGFENLVNSVLGVEPILDASIAGVVSNHSDGGVARRAERLHVPFAHFSPPYTAESYKEIISQFGDINELWVALSGWLKFVRGHNPQRTFNIHPGPLPTFGGRGLYGHRVHSAVLAAHRNTDRKSQVTESAVSMHFVPPEDVSNEYDTGPVFFRHPVPIEPGDDPDALGTRVNAAEHQWQPVITNLVVHGHIHWDGRNPGTLSYPPDYIYAP